MDVLLHMSRYELGVIPDELQRPLVDDPEGPAANTAYDYSERLPPTDLAPAELCAEFSGDASRSTDAHIQPVFSGIAGTSQSLEGAGGSSAGPGRICFCHRTARPGRWIIRSPNWARQMPGSVQRY